MKYHRKLQYSIIFDRRTVNKCMCIYTCCFQLVYSLTVLAQLNFVIFVIYNTELLQTAIL